MVRIRLARCMRLLTSSSTSIWIDSSRRRLDTRREKRGWLAGDTEVRTIRPSDRSIRVEARSREWGVVRGVIASATTMSIVTDVKAASFFSEHWVVGTHKVAPVLRKWIEPT